MLGSLLTLAVVVVKKIFFKLSLVLFSEFGLYQIPGSLRTHWRAYGVSRRVLFYSSTLFSQPSNLLAVAPSAPTTTEVLLIFLVLSSFVLYVLSIFLNSLI